MITDCHVSDYINSMAADLPDYLDELEQKAAADHVPIIRKEAQSLLCFLLHSTKPEKILEIGAAVGFSAMLMAENAGESASVTTIEKVEKRIKEARENIGNSPVKDRITLLEGEAADILKDLEGPYDFIFLDAAKGQYMAFLPEIIRLMPENGYFVTDNVLQNGSVAGSKFAVERRDRTIHMRMREYLYALTHSEELWSVILPVGDGMTISRKKTKVSADKEESNE